MEIGQVPAYKRWSNRYSHAFKMEVIEAFQSGQMSQRQVTRKYGVHRTTIVAWEKRYGNPVKNYLRMEEKTPQQELAELRAALHRPEIETQNIIKMKIQLNDSTSGDLHNYLKQSFKTKYQSSGYEHNSIFPRKVGNFFLKSFDFGNGFNFHIFKGDIVKSIQLQSTEDSNNFLRYIFVKEGEIILRLTKNVRYRLSSGYSSIVAAKGPNNQTFTFPVQNNSELFIIEINTHRFAVDIQTGFLGLPKELSDVFMNNQMEEHFVYHSSYVLSVADTYNEIMSTEAEGIVKRFFLESKVLELLWLQTEQYRHELLHGYDEHVLRRSDIKIIKQAKDYIHENLEIELTLKIIARAVGTNETKLKTGFKKLYGKTFSEILRNERLNNAKVLVEDGKLSIKEIAHKCGYKSISMFRLRFKERFGITPTQYQKPNSDEFKS